MLDSIGQEIRIGDDCVFAESNKHQFIRGKVVKFCPKTICISYTRYPKNGKEFKWKIYRSAENIIVIPQGNNAPVMRLVSAGGQNVYEQIKAAAEAGETQTQFYDNDLTSEVQDVLVSMGYKVDDDTTFDDSVIVSWREI